MRIHPTYIHPIFVHPAFVLAALFSAFTLCSPTPGRADTPPTQDIFIGNATPGPFALSWNAVQAYTESVAVNRQPQLRNLDYTLDDAAGTLTFTHSIPASAAISVTYTTVSGVSQHVGGGQTIPLSVDLLRDQHGYFSLDATGKEAAGTADSLAVGAGLGWHGGAGNQLATRFVYAPAAGTSSSADHTGISVSGTAGAGHWGVFSAAFSRAGAGMDTAAAGSSFQADRQLLTLGGTLTPVQAISAQLSFSRSNSLDSASTDTDASLALTAAPTATTRMQADVSQTSAGPGTTAQSVALSVDTQATKTLTLSAALTDRNQPGTANDSRTLALKTVLTPAKTYSLQVTADQSRLGAATTDQQAVTLALTPKPLLQMSAGFSMRQKSIGDSPDATDTSAATVAASVQPLSLLEVSGSYKSRLAPAADTNLNDLLDSSTAQIAFKPLKTITLTGTYAQNPDDSTDTLQRLARRGVGLETTFGALGLSGGCDWSRAYASPDVEQTIHAALGLRFSAATQLSVGYQTQQNLLDPAAPLATAYTVGFTHSLGDRFSVSFSGKRRQAATTASPDYNATASLGMKF